MRRVLLFLVCSVVFIIGVLSVGDVIPSVDPFDDRRPNLAQDFSGYDERPIALMKIRHSSERGRPYDVGLFGNSRILSVGRENITGNACSTFNYALSGHSFRSTVQLLERLSWEKALPRLAIISMDHFELQMTNNPVWTGWWRRWHVFLGDIAIAFREPNSDLRDKARIIWRLISTETIIFQRRFEFSFFRRAVLDALKWNGDIFRDVDIGRPGYRPDGSFYSPPLPPKEIAAMTRTTPQIINSVLRSDLERLFRMARDSNLKLVLYESPLHPASAVVFDAAPSFFADANRRTFLETCQGFGITCFSAPREPFLRLGGWGDASHPPPSMLGKWISSIIHSQFAGCTS